MEPLEVGLAEADVKNAGKFNEIRIHSQLLPIEANMQQRETMAGKLEDCILASIIRFLDS